MRLSEFIDTNRERILIEWEAFAGTLGPASDTMDIAALRDHASEMLTVVAADLNTPQTDSQQHEKSVGQAPADTAEPATPAEEHGADRAVRGFDIGQMVSEYRALRASVVRLWIDAAGTLEPSDLEDLTRFHEAIDQALAESVTRYTLDLDQSKEMFIGILGHDLRTPLSAIITSATFMLDLDELAEPHLTLTTRIASSSRRMQRMVSDLLDLTRSRLGGGIPVRREWMDLTDPLYQVVDEHHAVDPRRSLEVNTSGDLRGQWDGERLSQVLSNLLDNALDHRAQESPVTVNVHGAPYGVTISIHNHGIPIPPDLLPRIFDPMKRRHNGDSRARRGSSNLGLGLYIAERIVTAHGGRIDVSSTASAGTTFTVSLPRTM